MSGLAGHWLRPWLVLLYFCVCMYCFDRILHAFDIAYNAICDIYPVDFLLSFRSHHTALVTLDDNSQL
jgi:hypothetical protein